MGTRLRGSRKARHAGVSRKGEMPNGLNCSSYKKVGLFLFLRNAPCRQHARSWGTKGAKAGLDSVFCSGIVVVPGVALPPQSVGGSALWGGPERSYAEQFVLF